MKRAGLALALLLIAGAAAYYFLAPRNTPAGQPPLVSLSSGVSAVQEAFNGGSGSVRVLALYSPT